MRVPSSLGIWLLLGVLWMACVPFRPLFDPDEGRYAEIPREMAASGDWVTPRLNGLKYFEKPPLQYWATAAAYSVFGVHDWSSRLWATLLAFLCVPMVYLFTLRIGCSRDIALVSAALLAINPYYVVSGQLNLLDQGFTFFLCLAVFAFVLSQLESAGKTARNWMLLTWTALALAVLSKGIVALLLAGGTVCIHMLVSRDASLLRRLYFAWGLPLFLLITVPWFWLVQARNPEFAQFFFVHEHFARFLTNVHERVEPWYFFGVIVLLALLPVIWNVRHWRLKQDLPSRPFQVERFLLIWSVVVLVFFSLSHSKLASYVLPIMPPLAVLLARATAAQASAHRRATITILILLAVIASVVVAIGWRRYGTPPTGAVIWAGATLAVCMALIVYLWRAADASLARRWLALAVTTIAGIQCASMCYAATFTARSAASLASQFEGRITPDTELYSVNQYRHTLSWYLRREMRVYDYAGELAFGMEHSNGPGEQSRVQFLESWQHETKALAFIDYDVYDALRAAGMPGRIVARDARSIVVSRF
jgi:4-amino-4-deoxy-L-arabinose transferase-like glycosyltransferase